MLTSSEFAASVCRLQGDFTARWHVDVNADLKSVDTLMQLILRQHRFNFDLWHEEDKAREPGAQDEVIAKVKRNIDGLNQQRNDAITEIDNLLQVTMFADLDIDANLPWNSETLGSIIDRLSIAALKIFHMQEQADRKDAGTDHVNSCLQKVAELISQRDDLAKALAIFLEDILVGRKQNKLYHQFKMYNDPNLNPAIYAKERNNIPK